MRVTKPQLKNLICGELFGNERALRKYYLDKARVIKRIARVIKRIARGYWLYDFRRNLNESEELVLNYDSRNKIATIHYSLENVQRANNTREIISAVNLYSPLLEEVLRRTKPLLKK